MEHVIPTKANFNKAYDKESVAALKWTLGAASQELIDLVWKNKIKPNSKILEVGCGVGTEAVFLATRGMKVTATDISESCLKIGRDLANVYDVEVTFEYADVLDLNYEEGGFDVIVDRGCFHCFEGKERLKYAQNIAKVCKKGGLFVLRCFSYNEALNNQPWVRGSSSDDLIDLFLPSMQLDHMEKILSLPKKDGTRSEAWYSLWTKR